jgi:ATP-binding cassette subfamily B multidrug efflux pump
MLRFVVALVDVLRETSAPELLRAHGRQFLGIGLLILVGRPLASFTHDRVVQQAIARGAARVRGLLAA